MMAKIRVKLILHTGEKVWHLIDANSCTSVKKFLRLLKRKHGSSGKDKFHAYLEEFLLPKDSPIELIRDGDLIRITCDENKSSPLKAKSSSLVSHSYHIRHDEQQSNEAPVRRSAREARSLKDKRIESADEEGAMVDPPAVAETKNRPETDRCEQFEKPVTSRDTRHEEEPQILPSGCAILLESSPSSESDEVAHSKRQKRTLDYTPIEKQLIEEFKSLKRPKRKRKHKRNSKKQPDQVEQKEITLNFASGEPAPMNCSFDGTKTVFDSDDEKERTTPVADNHYQTIDYATVIPTTSSQVIVHLKQEPEISSASEEDFADSQQHLKDPATSSSTPRNSSQITTNKARSDHSIPERTPKQISTTEIPDHTPVQISTTEQSIEKTKSIIKQTIHKNGVTVFKRVVKPKLRATISPAILQELSKSAQQEDTPTNTDYSYHENATPSGEKTTLNTEKKITWHNAQKTNQPRKDIYENKSHVLTNGESYDEYYHDKPTRHHDEPTRHNDKSTRHEDDSTSLSDQIALLEKKLFYMEALTEPNKDESKIAELERELKALKRKGDKSKSTEIQIDFSRYPSIRTIPHVDDVIAFKVLEINAADCTPVVSEYKTGTVTNLDRQSKNVTIQLDNSTLANKHDGANRLAKFDVNMEDYQTEINPQDSLLIHADNLIDVRLVV